MIRLSRRPIACLTAMFIASLITVMAQASTQNNMPPMLVHETLDYQGKVIFDKQINLADTNSVGVKFKISINGQQQNESTEIVGSVGSAQVGMEDQNGNMLRGYMISNVVTDITKDGHANALIVYTIKNDRAQPGTTGLVTASVKLGEPYRVTTKDGTKIEVTVEKQS